MINKIINKPYLVFFLLVPVFIVLALLSKESSVDINFYDTYFVVSNYHFYLFCSIFFAMIGINYFSLAWAEKPPKKWFTITHIVLQILALFLFFTSNKWNWIGEQSHKDFNLLNDNTNRVLVFSFLIFLLSCFVHIINFFTSLFLRKN